MIGYALCGSFCTFEQSLKALKELASNNDILPIMSTNAYTTDTRFGTAEHFREQIEDICKRKIINTIKDAEPIGPRLNLELLIISPCTGNTLAKIAAGITDTPVTMAAKAHLRCARPLLIALATNDALGANLKNIGALCEKKNVYLTPMLQDDPINKPYSLVADFSKLSEAAKSALDGKQLRPIFL